MADRKKFPRLTECDGFVCGQNIKKGSLPVDRIIESELKEFIKEFIESSSDIDESWLIELIKKIMESQRDEEWLHELICNIDCSELGGDFDVEPKLIEVEATGGKKVIRVLAGASVAWSVVN